MISTHHRLTESGNAQVRMRLGVNGAGMVVGTNGCALGSRSDTDSLPPK